MANPTADEDKKGTVIMMQSVKGGVGKTTAGLAFAMALARKNSLLSPRRKNLINPKVCFIDLDLQGSNTRMLLGMTPDNNGVPIKLKDAFDQKTINDHLREHHHWKSEIHLADMRIEFPVYPYENINNASFTRQSYAKKIDYLDLFLASSDIQDKKPFMKGDSIIDPLSNISYRYGFFRFMDAIADAGYDYVVLDMPVGFEGLCNWVYTYFLTSDAHFKDIAKCDGDLREYKQRFVLVSSTHPSSFLMNIEWYFNWLLDAPQHLRVMPHTGMDKAMHDINYCFLLNDVFNENIRTDYIIVKNIFDETVKRKADSELKLLRQPDIFPIKSAILLNMGPLALLTDEYMAYKSDSSLANLEPYYSIASHKLGSQIDLEIIRLIDSLI